MAQHCFYIARLICLTYTHQPLLQANNEQIGSSPTSVGVQKELIIGAKRQYWMREAHFIPLATTKANLEGRSLMY
jgi:hypothetical protein